MNNTIRAYLSCLFCFCHFLVACGKSSSTSSNNSSSIFYADSSGPLLNSDPNTLSTTLPLEIVPYGEPNLSTSGSSGPPIPVSIIFARTQNEILTDQPEEKADIIIEELNKAFVLQDVSLMKFVKHSVQVKMDEQYFYTSCEEIINIAPIYSVPNTITIFITNHLSGSCAGSAFLFPSIDQNRAFILLKYKLPFVDKSFVSLAHEFGHIIGLFHSGVSSNPFGLKTFNSLLDLAANSPDRCPFDFMYYMSNQPGQTNVNIGGVSFNPYDNMMYQSFNPAVGKTFFTSGYDYSVSWAAHCWFLLNQAQFAQ
ncbi:MAG: hypothetical protein QE271_12060 [Bacteriovoracaceae bacterium]|nr:hypothetical protein [Bacteriovoracaceae bacterium]